MKTIVNVNKSLRKYLIYNTRIHTTSIHVYSDLQTGFVSICVVIQLYLNWRQCFLS